MHWVSFYSWGHAFWRQKCPNTLRDCKKTRLVVVHDRDGFRLIIFDTSQIIFWVLRSGLPLLGQENFPQLKQFFIVSGQKNLLRSVPKITRAEPVCPHIYWGSEVCSDLVGSQPTSSSWRSLSGINAYKELSFKWTKELLQWGGLAGLSANLRIVYSFKPWHLLQPLILVCHQITWKDLWFPAQPNVYL